SIVLQRPQQRHSLLDRCELYPTGHCVICRTHTGSPTHIGTVWSFLLDLPSLSYYSAAVRKPLRSPITGAAAPPVSAPPRPPLVSSRSSLPARKSAVHAAAGRSRCHPHPTRSARNSPGSSHKIRRRPSY